MAKIGFFGGTFDPIHEGHLNLAQQMIQHHYVDRVYMVVSNTPPHKCGKVTTSFTHRFEMVKLALQNEKNIFASDFEYRFHTAYTFDSLILMQKQHPEDTISLMIGSDSLAQLHTWSHAQTLVEQFQIITYPRPHVSLDELDKYWQGSALEKLKNSVQCNLKEIDISATQLRHMMHHGENVSLLPKSVINYIQAHRLYSIER